MAFFTAVAEKIRNKENVNLIALSCCRDHLHECCRVLWRFSNELPILDNDPFILVIILILMDILISLIHILAICIFIQLALSMCFKALFCVEL